MVPPTCELGTGAWNMLMPMMQSLTMKRSAPVNITQSPATPDLHTCSRAVVQQEHMKEVLKCPLSIHCPTVVASHTM